MNPCKIYNYALACLSISVDKENWGDTTSEGSLLPVNVPLKLPFLLTCPVLIESAGPAVLLLLSTGLEGKFPVIGDLEDDGDVTEYENELFLRPSNPKLLSNASSDKIGGITAWKYVDP